MNFYKIIKPIIFNFQPETAHNLSIKFLKHNPFFYPKPFNSRILHNEICGLDFKNPIGLAAGYDKNAEVIHRLFRYNFSFIEAGTVTLKPQIGNPPPRLFRLKEDAAVINRMGFNNLGKDVFLENIKHNKPLIRNCNLGINIGKNKTSEDYINDYTSLLKIFYPYANYITVNISSPNTPNLRELQKAENLEELIINLKETQENLEKEHNVFRPVFLKVAPDLDDNTLKDICLISEKHNVDALIISNTTISRPLELKSSLKEESGGLSGKPLLRLSTQKLRDIYFETKGSIPLIGVGGISNAIDAYQKILYGASLVQIYSAFVYEGFPLVNKIAKDLETIIKKEGFASIKDVIGKNVKF